MKRVLSLVLALVMVLGMIPTFAAEMTGGEHLLEHGFITGKPGDDVATKLDAGAALTRQELAALIAELMGQKDEAAVFAQPADYADADKIGAWAVPFVAYAQVNGWMSGKPGNLFDPTGPVPGQQLAAVLMNALGYTVDTQAKYATVIADAAGLGLAVPSGNLTRGQAFEAMWTAVSEVKVNGEDVTLGVKLGKLTPPAPVVTELKVASVVASNLKQVVVNFNQAVDQKTAETKANYKFAKVALATNDVVELSEDGMSVVITRDAVMSNGTSYDVSVSKVKSVAGAEMTAFEGKVVAFDNVIPEVVKVEFVGPRQVEVTFNEPIDNMNSVVTTVNNGAIGAINKGAKVGSNDTVLNVEIPTSLTENTTYTFRFSAAADFAGFTMIPKEWPVTFVKDTSIPVVTLKSGGQETVVLSFSKPVKNLAAARFYHTFASWTPHITDVDGNAIVSTNYYSEVKLDFVTPGRPLPEGTINVVVLVGPTNGEIQDAWGNKIVETSIPVVVVADRTAPTITSVVAKSEKSVEITYSKAVSGAGSSANFEVKDKDGKAVTGFSAAYSSTNNVFKTTLTWGTNLTAGDYTVTVKNIKDTTLYENALGTSTQAFAITDLTAPASIATAILVGTNADSIIYVTFDEAVATTGTNSALNKANYRIGSATLPTDSTITLFDSKTVKIEGFTTTPSGTLYVRNIADLAGNVMGIFEVLSKEISAPVAVAVEGIKTVALDKIEITVNQRLTSVDANSIQITASENTRLAAAASFENKSNGKAIITVVLNADNKLANSGTTTLSMTVLGTGNGIVPLIGSKMAAGAVVTTVTDGIAPVASAYQLVGDYQIVVTFDENLLEGSIALVGTNGFSVAGGTLTSAVRGSANTIVLTGTGFTVDTDVIYAPGNITDVAGNALAAFTKSTALTADTTAPSVVTLLPAAGNKTTNFTLVFSERLNDASRASVLAAVSAQLTDVEGTGTAAHTVAWTSATTLTVTVTVSGDGVVALGTVANQVVTDTVGNVSGSLALQ